jgi:hypothetical protein
MILIVDLKRMDAARRAPGAGAFQTELGDCSGRLRAQAEGGCATCRSRRAYFSAEVHWNRDWQDSYHSHVHEITAKRKVAGGASKPSGRLGDEHGSYERHGTWAAEGRMPLSRMPRLTALAR